MTAISRQPAMDHVRAIETIEIGTEHLPAAAQFEMFRHFYQGVVDIQPPRRRDAGFAVRQTMWHLGRFVLVHASLPGPEAAFSWRHMARPTFDHGYGLFLFERATPAAGLRNIGLSFHGLAHPASSEIAAHGMILLFMPHDPLSWTIGPVAAPNQAAGTGAGALLADLLAGLTRWLPQLQASELPDILDAIQSLILSFAASTQHQPDGARNSANTRLLERARRAVNRRLADDDLSPETLADELFVSRSRLYRVFEPFGGVAAYIQRQRLLRTRNALLDTEDTRPIFRIAEAWGFSDPSCFSRSFRREFGLSPTQIRRTGRSSDPLHEGSSKIEALPNPLSLAAMLRRMRA